MSRRPLHRNQILSIPETSNVQRFNPAVRRETVIHIFRNHMLVNQKVDTAIPAYLFVGSESRSNLSPEPDPGLNHRLHRKYLASTRPLHVRRPSTIDLPTLHHWVERIIRPA